MVLIQQECVIPVLFTVSRQYKPTRDATRGLMTLKRSSSNACAACKYQRRKCTPECQLAQYFPSDKPGVFKNAHRLFGVKNILNILKSIHDPAQKTDAMTSIIYQANLREMFPVRGCCHLIDSYYAQIQLLEEELHAVHSQLDFYRTRRHNQVPTSMATQLELGMAPPNMNPNHLLRHEIIALPQLGYSGGIAIHPNNDDSPYAYLESRQDALQAAGVIPNYGSVHPFFESDDNGTQSYIATSSEDMKDKTQSKERLLLRTR